MLRKTGLLLMVVGLLLLGACTQEPEQEEVATSGEEVQSVESESLYPMTVTDSYDREIILPEQPERVISMAPSITETIFALEAESQLVGRTEYCDYPEEVAKIPTAGSLMTPNMERIIELEPDLVIASTHFPMEAVETLEELGVQVVVFVPQESFEGTYRIIEEVGRILGKDEKAQTINQSIEEKVREVAERVADLPGKRVYFVVGFGEHGDYTAGGDTFINEMIEMAGGVNIAGDVSGWGYSLEKIIEKDPEVIIISKFFGLKDAFEMTPNYMDLNAVKKGELHGLDINEIERQGPRIGLGLESLAKAIHGDRY
ncbi:MAG: hypothetical protein AVO33_05305 [delta proteobacterium ML8_F1]|nr:MAG: hypothetical protein AVO33_05305 [delta proteobacterium ML8_F1]